MDHAIHDVIQEPGIFFWSPCFYQLLVEEGPSRWEGQWNISVTCLGQGWIGYIVAIDLDVDRGYGYVGRSDGNFGESAIFGLSWYWGILRIDRGLSQELVYS